MPGTQRAIRQWRGLLFLSLSCSFSPPFHFPPQLLLELLPWPPRNRPSSDVACLAPLSSCSIQIVSTSSASQTVTLVYVVGNRSSFLNGTVASSLLRQLSAELVGFYLTYPPLTIAEREYVTPRGDAAFPHCPRVLSPFKEHLWFWAQTNPFIIK